MKNEFQTPENPKDKNNAFCQHDGKSRVEKINEFNEQPFTRLNRFEAERRIFHSNGKSTYSTVRQTIWPHSPENVQQPHVSFRKVGERYPGIFFLFTYFRKKKRR